MAVEIPRALIEYILLGSGDSRRQLQDSPILGDVWMRYAEHPAIPADLLITSHKDRTAGELAAELYEGIGKRPKWGDDDPEIAPLQTFVAARLYFDELLRIVVPRTKWWHEKRTQDELKEYLVEPAPGKWSTKITQTVADIDRLIGRWGAAEDTGARRSGFDRFVALCALVFLAKANVPDELAAEANAVSTTGSPTMSPQQMEEETAKVVEKIKQSTHVDIERAVSEALRTMHQEPLPDPLVFQISLNRKATLALERSVPTVKADAARRLFDVNCRDISWAIIDSGIDAEHSAFLPGQIKATFDFTNYRQIVSLGNNRPAIRRRNLERIQTARGGELPPDADRKLKELAASAVKGRSVRWDLVREFVELDKPPQPASDHGTHVAGIIGATKRANAASGDVGGNVAARNDVAADGDDLARADDDSSRESADGMCPGIGIYDFRILGSDIVDTEFAVIAALQFIRYTNEQAGFMLVNGVNMSLSIPHDVRNYACGGTPVCTESERLVDNGVVVVAAAGNLGYQHTTIGGQVFDNYAAFSITDPGNADRVITVGSTHRYAPFTYGVSYFSSRGPTGDGRLKPDLVAPGERIHAPLPGERWGCLDGTSMAAPHVSGAAAMLMARYPELIGKPGRIKKILCDTATDLGRERNFQGHGMLDVLRALQSQ